MSGDGDMDGEHSEPEESYGCIHYKRHCALISPCCNKVYTCRICHDEKENHILVRKDVKSVQCLKCETKQKVQSNCENCDAKFGNYFCEKCCLYDDDTDKKQFHCDPCGLCRVGGRDNYFHCPKCDMCLANDLKDNHTCVEKSSRSDCAVCLQDLHTSRIPSHIPPCGHLIHMQCYKDMIKTGNYTCPLCNLSMVDMSEVWKQLDEEIATTPMPDEYKDFKVQILCRDCHKESRVVFHVIGLKCQDCGSYNTARTAEPEKTTTKTDAATN
ncbi:hypothetical protein KUTeg_016076 [Tegillarca granosa]|uniref:RING finger and CHY zinc finger domain-containing protein 1 n=1 Tax=Tegillarca granosa TaxID=220873 RepID=A0ABQ9ENP3_TEGGR|nr:hypothetical protein KUTeg_016076 [Tegillarca granosa]